MVEYNPNMTWPENMAEKHMAHMGKLGEAIERRDNLAGGETFTHQDVGALDRHIEKLARHASASETGYVYHDPSDPTSCTKAHQTWVAEARKRGRVLGPGYFEASTHDEPDAPLKVDRGYGSARDGLGSPTVITR